jgi:hypothetical protein
VRIVDRAKIVKRHRNNVRADDVFEKRLVATGMKDSSRGRPCERRF